MKHHLVIWNFTQLYLMWLLWKERNNWVFEAKVNSKYQLEDIRHRSLLDWSCVWGLIDR